MKTSYDELLDQIREFRHSYHKYQNYQNKADRDATVRALNKIGKLVKQVVIDVKKTKIKQATVEELKKLDELLHITPQEKSR